MVRVLLVSQARSEASRPTTCSSWLLPDPRVDFVAVGGPATERTRFPSQAAHPSGVFQRLGGELHSFRRVQPAPTLQVDLATGEETAGANLSRANLFGQLARRPKLRRDHAGVDPPRVRFEILAPGRRTPGLIQANLQVNPVRRAYSTFRTTARALGQLEQQRQRGHQLAVLGKVRNQRRVQLLAADLGFEFLKPGNEQFLRS